MAVLSLPSPEYAGDTKPSAIGLRFFFHGVQDGILESELIFDFGPQSKSLVKISRYLECLVESGEYLESNVNLEKTFISCFYFCRLTLATVTSSA